MNVFDSLGNFTTVFATVDEILGVGDLEDAETQLSVNPNPFSSTVIFTIDGTSQSVDFKLFNMIGKKVQALYSISSPTFEVSRNELPDGIYLYRIISGTELLKTGKVIIE